VEGHTPEIVAITLTFVVHVAGAVALVWAMLGDEEKSGGRRRGWWPGSGGDGPPPRPQDPPPSGDRLDALPPDARPSRVRLREPGRIRDGYQRRPRRPEHAPEPTRTPERT
jgi:hypothetical protein